MEGIKTDKLESVTRSINAKPELLENFDECVRLYTDYIKETTKGKNPSDLNIAGLNISGAEMTASGTKAGGKKVEDRYYGHKEYVTLNAEQKKTLDDMRKARGHVKGDKTGGNKRGRQHKGDKGNESKTVKKLSRQVAKLASQIKAKDAPVVESSDIDDTTESGGPKKKSNRNNAALSRKKSKKVGFKD